MGSVSKRQKRIDAKLEAEAQAAARKLERDANKPIPKDATFAEVVKVSKATSARLHAVQKPPSSQSGRHKQPEGNK